MSKKGYSLVLVYAVLTLLMGLVFLFDALGIAFTGAIAKWYLVLLLYVSAGFIAIAIIRSAPMYYTVASIFIGIFLSLSFNKPFSEFWALIPISISIGMIVTHIVSRGRLRYLYAALILLILSTILLIGGITHSWKYVVPAELIAIGIIAIVIVSYKLAKSSNKDTKTLEEDYHVRPTNEINKEEE